MPRIDDILEKEKSTFEKIRSEGGSLPAPVLPKKIETKRATRPWQVNLPQYQTNKPSNSSSEEKVPGKQQTGNKPATNWQQTGNKLATNWQQTEYENIEVATNRQQTGNRSSNKPATNRQQTGNKPATNSSFSALVGLQRKAALFFYELCRNERTQITPPLTLEYVAHILETTENSTKVTLQRLEQKKIIRRVNYKVGRGGWSEYELLNSIFQEIAYSQTGNKLATNWQQTDNKPSTKPATSPSSSSSIDLNKEEKEKTTTSEPTLGLSDEWQKVDISPLAEYGFTQTHLIQLARSNKLPPQEIQNSIDFFAFDLKKNKKAKVIKGDIIISYFMGPRRRGEPYAPPSNYEDPKDEAMRIYKEGLVAIRKREEEQEKETKQYARDLWMEQLTVEEKEKIVPHIPEGNLKRVTLSDYFDREVWPHLKRQAKQNGNPLLFEKKD